MTPLQLRDELIKAKQMYGRGEIDIEKLYVAADAYIEAIKAFAKRTGNKKLRAPSRAYLIRAI